MITDSPAEPITPNSFGQGLPDQHDRYRDLSERDITGRSLRQLQDEGRYDGPLDPANYPPLTLTEHLEVIALGESIARFYRHPANVHRAVCAGATWAQVAAALGATAEQARADYRAWAEEQHRLYEREGGRFGMNAQEYRHALDRCGADDA